MHTITPIAHIHTDFSTKFGIPRQSGLVDALQATIVFEPAFRVREALRGLEEYSHIWLIWGFSEVAAGKWSPTVRPPRLNGNTRMGVFATRSPFRPNGLGLSSVRLVEIGETPSHGQVLVVAGADLMNGTPIYDIKPYLPYTDSHPEACGGFAARVQGAKVQVEIDADFLAVFPQDKQKALQALLAEDPRPSYQEDSERIYGMPFAGFDVRFRVRAGVLHVVAVEKCDL